MNDQQQIERALTFLAGVCDFANRQDGQGFNKFDADRGHELANVVASGVHLTVRDLSFALRLLQKYRRQIEGAGLSLPNAPEPTLPVAYIIVRTERTAGVVLVFFPSKPSPRDYQMISNIPGRRWLPNMPGMPWSVPIDQFGTIEAYFKGRADVEYKTGEGITPDAIPAPKPKQEYSSTNYVELSLDDGRVIIHFGGPDFWKIKDTIKIGVTGSKWEPNLKGTPWSCPASNLAQLLALFPDATLSGELANFANELKQRAELGRKATGDFQVPGFGLELMPFQRTGVQCLDIAKGRMILGDEMGLGKTIQELAYLQLHPEIRPAVLVVPAAVKINWLREAARCLTTGDRFIVAEGRKPVRLDLTGATILIINYDILGFWAEAILSWKPKHICFDEAHYLKTFRPNRKKKSANSNRANAAFDLAGQIESVIPMTGTAVLNKPVELFPLLYLVDPKSWPSFWKFADRYCGANTREGYYETSGATNLDELYEKVKPYFIRRTKTQVLSELPDKRRATMVIKFDERQRKEYFEYIEAAVQSSAAEALVAIEKAKQAAARGKIGAAIEWIASLLETGEKLVVFCTHHWTVDTLMDAFPEHSVRITGKENLRQRQEAIDQFQSNDSVNLAVCNIQAAGIGITLTAASNVAFVEFAWRPADHTQAEDRLHRIGQKNSVTAWYLVAEGTIDEDIVALLEEKREIVEIIHDGQVSDLAFESEGDVIQGDRNILAALIAACKQRLIDGKA